MNIYGLVVTKNECERYLQACLNWHEVMLDGILVYDDKSTDETADVCATFDVEHYVRPDDVPTFMEHEGRFRQHSLDVLVETFDVKDGDWIAVIDTDEFLLPAHNELTQAVTIATSQGCKSLSVPRPELWSLDPPMERVDGFWGNQRCTRVFRWESGGKLADKHFACGNEPTYVAHASKFSRHPISLVHVGYVEEQDRVDKYTRYTSLEDHGHNEGHIQSILGTPSLKSLPGAMPDVWRGLVSL